MEGTKYMRTFLLPALLSLVLILSACSTKSPAPTGVAGNQMGSDNSQMGSGDMDMSEPSGAATPTPGSMMPTNPEAAHMMEPIGGSNVQAATETVGGQPLAYREENGVKAPGSSYGWIIVAASLSLPTFGFNSRGPYPPRSPAAHRCGSAPGCLETSAPRRPASCPRRPPR